MSELKTLLTYYKAGETVDVIAKVQSSDGYTEQTFTLTLASKDVFGNDASSVTGEQGKDASQDQTSPDDNIIRQNPYSFFWPFSQQTP